MFIQVINFTGPSNKHDYINTVCIQIFEGHNFCGLCGCLLLMKLYPKKMIIRMSFMIDKLGEKQLILEPQQS